MNIFKSAVCCSLFALAVCAQQPVQSQSESPAPAEQPPGAAPTPKPRVVVRPNVKAPVLPAQAMSQSVLFKLLLAEIALQRGQNNVAVQSFLDLTKETRDPRIALRADWEQAALFQGQVLQHTSNADALAYYQVYLKTNPRAMDVRLSYARLLVTDKKYAEARGEFQALLKEFPNNADVTMAVALLSLQLNDFDAAETQLKHALETDYKDPDAVRFYLGQVNEERKRPDDALRWYSSVSGGDQYVPSRARYAGILAKQGKLGDARTYLQQAGRNGPDRVQFTQAEAQLLRDANDYRAAFDLLGQAIVKNPNSPDLLYDQAMAAEKVDRMDVLESNLRKVIQLKPDYAHAYNALGYTFADRNTRLDEAYTLVEQALKVSPEDPFIMDSMGWVLFRMNQNDAAITFLKRAFEIRPDAEIAAHLGEVLWAAGRQDEAKKVWASALKDNPANELLSSTVKKFSP